MKIIAITGASGFIGKNVVTHFLKKGYRVKALVRSDHPFQKNTHLEIVRGDMRIQASLEKLISGANTVIHLAAAKSDEKESYEVNVKGMEHLIHACRKNSIKKVVYVSTASVYLKQQGAYASTKKAAEDLLLNSGLNVTILRPSIIYGDFQNGVFGSLALASALPVTPMIGSGTCFFYPLFIEDFAQSLQSAVEKNLPERIYDVGGREKISFEHLVRLIGEQAFNKRKIRVFHIPVSLGVFISRILALFSRKPLITRSNILGSTQQIPFNVLNYFADFHITPLRLSEGILLLKNRDPEEPKILFDYVASLSKERIPLTSFEIQLYRAAREAYQIPAGLSAPIYFFPFLLGFFDIASKFFYPQSNLQNKIRIAATLVECHPASASWLLPKNRSLLRLLGKGAFATARAGIKLIGGGFLLLIPGMVKKYV